MFEEHFDFPLQTFPFDVLVQINTVADVSDWKDVDIFFRVAVGPFFKTLCVSLERLFVNALHILK